MYCTVGEGGAGLRSPVDTLVGMILVVCVTSTPAARPINKALPSPFPPVPAERERQPGGRLPVFIACLFPGRFKVGLKNKK